MGMPITVEIVDIATPELFSVVYDYFKAIDARFSTYKPSSEISQINKGLPKKRWSAEMKHVMRLCQDTKEVTNGYFDIDHDGTLDPSGLVKGWAIKNAADLLLKQNIQNFYIEAGGDIQAEGKNAAGQLWEVGIRNPFMADQIIKVVNVSQQGVATSGTYIRGQHIYNPHADTSLDVVKSLTIIGPNIYEADRFATAAFAMGPAGIAFIQQTQGLEGYMIDANAIATYTSGFERYLA
jgi:thiamine biosynthesis lipoprotein